MPLTAARLKGRVLSSMTLQCRKVRPDEQHSNHIDVLFIRVGTFCNPTLNRFFKYGEIQYDKVDPCWLKK